MTGEGVRGHTAEALETFRVVDYGESPILPAGLRRFWWDPLTAVEKPVKPVEQHSSPEIVSLRGPGAMDPRGAYAGAKKLQSD